MEKVFLTVQMGRRQSSLRPATLFCLHTGTEYTRWEWASREPELVPLYRSPGTKEKRKTTINAVPSYPRADE